MKPETETHETMKTNRTTTLLALTAALLTLGACDDDDGVTRPAPGGDGEEQAVVLNSIGLTLSVFPTQTLAPVRTIELGPQGSPVSLAVRDSIAIVPMGVLPSVAVVNLESGAVRSIPLPAGSGATGVAIVNDSLAFVANPALNTVSPILYDRGAALPQIDVGDYPQLVLATDDRVLVGNARLDDDTFQPDGPGTLTVIDAERLEVTATVQLSGISPAAGVVRDGDAYVLHNGEFGMENGSLSVVDLTSLEEVRHAPGLGEFPGSLARLPDGSFLFTSFQGGVRFWDPSSGVVWPARLIPAIAIGVDHNGLIYALDPVDYQQPGRVQVLSGELSPVDEFRVGTVPIAIGFTRF